MAINKFSLIGFLVFCNVLLVTAQVDSKYLAGAVPEVNGKVLFTREVKVSSSVSNDQLYGLVKEWMYEEFSEKEDSKQRVLLADKDQNYIVAQGDEKLVFKAQILMVDQTDMTYQFIARTEKGKCMLEMRNIKYEYQDYDKPVSAEEMITDKVALHKSGEKLNRHYDKFRTFTIDRVDELQASLRTHLGKVSLEDVKVEETKVASIVDVEELPRSTSMKAKVPAAVSVSSTVASEGMAGYKQMSADQISESITKMFKDSRAVVSIGEANDAKTLTGAWSGTGNFGGKPVAMVFVNAESDASKEQVYTISFYTEIHGDALDRMAASDVSVRSKTVGLTPIVTPSGASAFGEAWMVIECKKMTEQDSSESELKENAQSKQWKSNKNVKSFMGEIINVWAR